MKGSIVVAGVGPGLGLAVSRRFAREGHRVAMLARDAGRLAGFARSSPELLVPIPCDLTSPAEVTSAMTRSEAELGPIECAVFNAGAFRPGSILDISPDDFERCWRVGAFAGFLLAQAAARAMVARARGTILFTGATASLRGGAGFANLASPKFALRALAQSMARELGPKGIHVAHIIIDGQIGSEQQKERGSGSMQEAVLDGDAIAETYLHLHQQPRSTWAFEVDLRPWCERF